MMREIPAETGRKGQQSTAAQGAARWGSRPPACSQVAHLGIPREDGGMELCIRGKAAPPSIPAWCCCRLQEGALARADPSRLLSAPTSPSPKVLHLLPAPACPPLLASTLCSTQPQRGTRLQHSVQTYTDPGSLILSFICFPRPFRLLSPSLPLLQLPGPLLGCHCLPPLSSQLPWRRVC